MATPFIGEILISGFNFAPRNYAFCNGQLLSIAQNTALFALLGTTYGGDGRVTFGLPDLRGRVPNHFGQGPGLPNFNLGQVGGEETHTLSVGELPAHNHLPNANSAAANASNPINNIWGMRTANPPYSATSSGQMSPTTIAAAGGGQPHNNLSPFLVLNFCIAIQGIFPSRN